MNILFRCPQFYFSFMIEYILELEDWMST